LARGGGFFLNTTMFASRASAKAPQGTPAAADGFRPGKRKGVTAMRLKRELFSVAVAAGLVFTAVPAFADAYRLDYRVSHSKYGNIGSFSNSIDKQGQTTTVTTNTNIKVKVIGITAFKQEAQRVEKWNGDKLVYFHAVTNING